MGGCWPCNVMSRVPHPPSKARCPLGPLVVDGWLCTAEMVKSNATGVNAKHLGHRMKVHDGHGDDHDGNGWMGNAKREGIFGNTSSCQLANAELVRSFLIIAKRQVRLLTRASPGRR